jgi:hypothetical protein
MKAKLNAEKAEVMLKRMVSDDLDKLKKKIAIN